MFRCNTILLLMLSMTACSREAALNGPSSTSSAAPQGGVQMTDFSVTTTAFERDKTIPTRFTADGDDVSPALAWSGVPNGAKTLAVICDDPDAPTAEPWVHWVIFNIPTSLKSLPEGIEKTSSPKSVSGASQGQNTWGKRGWNGPSPPKGHGVHHYHFKVYALNETLTVTGEVDKKKLLAAMENHVVGQGEIIGTYERK